MIKVFLASSSKWKPENGFDKDSPVKLQKVIKSIRNTFDNVKIEPWWECEKLNKTDFILTIIEEIVNDYNMGIFVLSKDLYGQSYAIKKQEKNNSYPNHNVIAELAMFHNSGKKIYIITEDYSEIKIPSDFGGLNSVPIINGKGNINTKGILSGVKATLDSIGKIPEESHGRYHVLYDPKLSGKYIGFYGPQLAELSEWESKALYVGSKSAYLWKKIEEWKDYPEKITIQNFTSTSFAKRRWDHDNTIGSLKELDIDNVISFGPGVGIVDKELISKLEKKIQYIPVDMNVFLAMESVSTMRVHRHVPFAIIDDFEKDPLYSKLISILECNKSSIGRNNLFSMIGVTFSNLSMTCDTFFTRMKSLMQDEKDYLLIDVIIADRIMGDISTDKNNSAVINDRIIKDIKEKINTQKGYWELIHNSIKRKGLLKGRDISSDNLFIDCFPSDSNEYQNRTTVEDTIVAYIKFEDNIITIAKYYKYQSFKDYLKSHFDIVVSAKYPNNSRGIFLLKNKCAD